MKISKTFKIFNPNKHSLANNFKHSIIPNNKTLIIQVTKLKQSNHYLGIIVVLNLKISLIQMYLRNLHKINLPINKKQKQ
jgi:hypothetical protein